MAGIPYRYPGVVAYKAFDGGTDLTKILTKGGQLIKTIETLITSIIFYAWILMNWILISPLYARGNGIQDTIWGTEIIKRIDEKANSTSGDIKTGNMQRIDTSIQYIADLWQAYVDQEQEVFSDEIEKADSLGTLFNAITSNIQFLKDANPIEEASTIQGLLDGLSDASKEILGYISKPVLLVFIGPKCQSWPNCKARQRTMESVENIVSKFATRIRISIIDVKKKKQLAKQYKIMLAPTLVLIDSNGKEVYRRSGETTDCLIEDELKKLISE